MNNHIYFLSDFHLGVPDDSQSLDREKRIVRFLESIKDKASEIYLVGDIFDMWFEYKTVVPKGHVRLLGKLAELTDNGIKITAFTGNHDMWMFGYFEKELNIPVLRKPIITTFGNRTFYVGHGDGLGPGDKGYKFIKKVFANKISQWLFGILHPDIGLRVANFWSRRSRISTGEGNIKYLGDDKEYLVLFCKEQVKLQHVDYFIFGHRHLPLDKKIGEKSRYINLGDWIDYNTYAVFDGTEIELKKFEA